MPGTSPTELSKQGKRESVSPQVRKQFDGLK
jgi:hypothetical protein